MSPRTTINTFGLQAQFAPKGFKAGGRVDRELTAFDRELTQFAQEQVALQLQGKSVSKRKREELEQEYRKQALSNEKRFEARLAKAYRHDYGGKIPTEYLKQAVRAVKNMLERVRFYTYSIQAIPITDYAPPLAGQDGGKKFTELENKSWASISEPGDSREEGWHQSDTADEEIIRNLQKADVVALAEVSADRPDEPAVKKDNLAKKPKKKGNLLPQKHKEHSTSFFSKALKRPKVEPKALAPCDIPIESVEDPHSAGQTSGDELDNQPKEGFTKVHLGSPWQEKHEGEIKRESVERLLPPDAFDGVEFSAPTPAAYVSPPNRTPMAWEFPVELSPSPPPHWESRAPTPGLDPREELKKAIESGSIDDITHYLNQAHPGTVGQRSRATFRLGRDMTQGKEIQVDLYLQGSGPTSRVASPRLSVDRTPNVPELISEEVPPDVSETAQIKEWLSSAEHS